MSFKFDVVDAEKASLIKGGVQDSSVDNQNRGRISNGNPKGMWHLQISTNARVGTCDAFIVTNGRPSIVHTTRFDGFAKNLGVTETVELVLKNRC